MKSEKAENGYTNENSPLTVTENVQVETRIRCMAQARGL